jgi:hypothetical protein
MKTMKIKSLFTLTFAVIILFSSSVKKQIKNQINYNL